MNIKNLIKKLEKFDANLEVRISDGYEGVTYHTNNVDLKEFKEDDETITLDIGIGGKNL